MQTLAPIRKRAVQIEFNPHELALLEAAMFDSLVRLLKDSHSFDITDFRDDDALLECQKDGDAIKNIQTKIKAARRQIDREPGKVK